MAKQAATGQNDPIKRSDRFTSTGQTSSLGHATPNQPIASTSTQPNSSINIEKILAEYKNDLAKMIKENLAIDVRGKTQSYQKPYPIYFDMVTYPAGFRLPEFVKSNGEDNKSTFEHISQYIAQLGEASSVNELKVRLFFYL